MYCNSITLKELSQRMYAIQESENFEMQEYAECFNDLMAEYNFRYKNIDDIQEEFVYDMRTDLVEDLFLDKINRMDISEKIFYDIAFEFIEPKIFDHILIPQLVN